MARKLQVIGKNLSGEITAPENAEVGQILAVKAVDENGKPIEWEAVDFPEVETDTTGRPVKGDSFIIDGDTVIAEEGAEIFNDYENNIATGPYSHAEGSYTTASGEASHAEGYHAIASCAYSHAEGYYTIASDEGSHAEGCGTIAAGFAQHVQGKCNVEDPESKYAHIVGNGDSDTPSNAHTLDWDGNAWFKGKVYTGGTGQDYTDAKELATVEYVNLKIKKDPETENNTAGRPVKGDSFVVNGETVVAEEGAEIFNDYENNIATGMYSHAEGYCTTASGVSSHAEGYYTTASSYASHAEGSTTTASGASSHAEGYSTTASGDVSHAEGRFTRAHGHNSHAEGRSTRAYGRSQHVQGEYNIYDPEWVNDSPNQRGKYAHVVGNGTDDELSNAHTLDWDGNAWFQGKVFVGGSGQDDADARELVISPAEVHVGQPLVVKDVDENNRPTEWEFIDFPDVAESVINVLELPDVGWDETRLYRLQRPRWVINRTIRSDWTCYAVQSLPETGEPALVGDPSDIDSVAITAYVAYEDGLVYGYANSDLATAFEVPEGWYPIEDMFSVVGWNYAGLIADIVDDPCDDTYRIAVDAQLYYRMNDYWYPVDSTSFRGTAQVGQALTVKTVDEYGRPTEWQAVDFPTDGSGSGNGTATVAGKAIIDVVELPTENIDEDVFYRVLRPKLIIYSEIRHAWPCYPVESLPETGEPVLFGDFEDLETVIVTSYYNIDDGGLYGYVNADLSSFIGIPEGWYLIDDVVTMLGFTYSGVIFDIADDPDDGAFRLLVEHTLYTIKNDKWTAVDVIGWRGTGVLSEKFNHPYNTASGNYSHAEGNHTTASGDYSHAEGMDTTASGFQSHAEGNSTTASGNESHAEGLGTTASSWNSHAEGYFTTASGDYSHAEGNSTTASGECSHAEGRGTTATGWNSHAEGEYTTASGENSHAEGMGELREVRISGDANATTYIVDNSDASYVVCTYNVGMYLCYGTIVARIIEATAATDGAGATLQYASTITLDKTLSTDSPVSIENHVHLLGGATGLSAHVEGTGCLASGDYSSARGYGTIASGKYATAEGNCTIASGPMSHAEGGIERCPPTTASGHYSHAEGVGSVASGATSHAQGFLTLSAGSQSHAEGYKTESLRSRSHAEGHRTFATGLCSHSEGKYTFAKGDYSHAEGVSSIGTPWYLQHTPGLLDVTVLSESEYESRYRWAGTKGSLPALNSLLWSRDGLSNEIGLARVTYVNTDDNSFTVNQPLYLVNGYARLYSFGALGEGSHVEGMSTTAASAYQHVQGKCNVEDLDNRYAHIVGGGTGLTSPENVGGAFSNIHTLDWHGNASWLGASGSTTGADYAEYFEWADGNPDNEDRVGLIVSLDGDKIRLATSEDDDVLGIISGTAAVIGDTAEWEWKDKYITDEFGRIVWDMIEEFVDEEEEYEVMVEEAMEHVDEDGNVTTETVQVPKTETRTVTKSVGFFPHRRLNPDYDPNKEYVPRADRPEWDTVGMLGKLHVRDDGTCRVNGYACVGENGVATASAVKTNMRVLARVNDNIIRVLLK